jgi:hypothetical protein
LPLLLLFTQRLDLLKAADELLFGVGDHLLQPLNVICAVIQHILHVSSSSLYVKIFLSSAVKIFSEFKTNC